MGGVFKSERLIELLVQAQERLSEDTRDWEMADAVEEARCRLENPESFIQWPIPPQSDRGAVE